MKKTSVTQAGVPFGARPDTDYYKEDLRYKNGRVLLYRPWFEAVGANATEFLQQYTIIASPEELKTALTNQDISLDSDQNMVFANNRWFSPTQRKRIEQSMYSQRYRYSGDEWRYSDGHYRLEGQFRGIYQDLCEFIGIDGGLAQMDNEQREKEAVRLDKRIANAKALLEKHGFRVTRSQHDGEG